MSAQTQKKKDKVSCIDYAIGNRGCNTFQTLVARLAFGRILLLVLVKAYLVFGALVYACHNRLVGYDVRDMM